MASPAPLAEIEDIEDRLGRDITADETSKVAADLRDASAVVRSYTRRPFTQATETIRVRPRGGKVILPMRPVIAVDSVKIVSDFNGTTYSAPTVWSYVSGFEIQIVESAIIINGPEVDWHDDNVWAEVTYTHGYEQIPDDIVAVVCAMVVRKLTLPAGGLIDQEAIGPYSTRYSGAGVGGPLSTTDGERRILNSYRRGTSTIELR